jgi:hypothetical protein
VQVSEVKLQIKGLIRFSYLSEGGFALSKLGHDAVQKILYDPERLMRRFALFEHLTLRSLQLQTNADFRVGILIGESFPRYARDHLENLLSNVPQAQIIQLPHMVHYRAIRVGFEELGNNPAATHTATFRLDDDDALHGACRL